MILYRWICKKKMCWNEVKLVVIAMNVLLLGLMKITEGIPGGGTCCSFDYMTEEHGKCFRK